jgi:hypothetical protein
VKSAALLLTCASRQSVQRLSRRRQQVAKNFDTAANNILDLIVRLGAGALKLSASPKIRENDFKY